MIGAEHLAGYRPDYCKQAFHYCRLGATNDDLAACFEVNRRTLDNWIVNIPAFAEAVQRGREPCEARVMQALYRRAIGYTYTLKRTVLHRGEERTLTRTVYCPADPRAGIFWMRNNQFGGGAVVGVDPWARGVGAGQALANGPLNHAPGVDNPGDEGNAGTLWFSGRDPGSLPSPILSMTPASRAGDDESPRALSPRSEAEIAVPRAALHVGEPVGPAADDSGEAAAADVIQAIDGCPEAARGAEGECAPVRKSRDDVTRSDRGQRDAVDPRGRDRGSTCAPAWPGGSLHVDNPPHRPEAGGPSHDGAPLQQTWIGAVETYGTLATTHPPP